MYSECDNCCSQQLGFPIRTSPDHGLLASPRGLSQLATSFIAYLRQGIHTHALSSLTIKLTLDTNAQTALALKYAPTRHTNRHYLHFLLALHAVYWLHGVIATCVAHQYSIVKDQRHSSAAKTQHPASMDSDFLILLEFFLIGWWAWVESNYRPHPYQGCALATELQARTAHKLGRFLLDQRCARSHARSGSKMVELVGIEPATS